MAKLAPMRPWSPDFLAFVLPLRPEQVLRVEGRGNSATPESRAEWAWINTAQRLAFTYGEAAGLERLNAAIEGRAADGLRVAA